MERVESASPAVSTLNIMTSAFNPVGKTSSSTVRDMGFTALCKYDHLLGPVYSYSHSFSAHLNCPICLTQSIDVVCLRLDGF